MADANAISGLITEVAYNAAVIIIPTAIAMGAELLRRKLGTEKLRTLRNELETKKTLGIMAVRYVEQAYKDQHGQDKYDLAADWLASKARQHGLKLTADEVEALIESSIKALKEACSLEWSSPEGRA